MAAVALALTGPRTVALVEEPTRPLGPGEVRLRTLLSGVSGGTELAAYRGSIPFLTKAWDAERRIFGPGPPLTFPLTRWGYEEVGEVVEVGPGVAMPLGTRVFGTWGHRSEHIAAADWAAEQQLPAETDPALGVFSHIGATALNGALDAAPRLGETAAVFGLGVLGQLVAQLLRLTGAQVIAVEPLPLRREIARSLGSEILVDPVVTTVAERIRELTDARGADVCLEVSGVAAALHEAVRSCAYASRVVALGFYQGGAAALRLGEEFHHNRIALISSQIGGLAPELSPRWSRRRLVETFMQLALEQQVRCTDLITHRVPVADAAALFRLLDEEPGEVLQAVLDFGPA
ncbi:MAG TPA: zinc-binding alcohol dehydrogenase [Chloroflexota bacterium]|nr:zinc-binding alcohol dehydrogenase [Chloroflexota bacterium]